MDKSRILVAPEPIEREVTFTDGTVEKCHFRQVTGAQWRRWAESERAESQDVRLGQVADVDVVAHAGAVRGVVVVAENFELGPAFQHGS